MELTLETDRLVLRALKEKDWQKVLRFLEKGKDVFERYEAAKPPLYYSKIYQKGVLNQEYNAMVANRYVRYYVSLKEEPDIVIGTVSCGSITSDPFYCGTLGYKFDKDYWHKGYATEAIRCTINQVFKELRLHRLIANVMETNNPSIKLLENMGFRLEGLCEKNIKVNGEWQNHRLYAMLNPYEEVV